MSIISNPNNFFCRYHFIFNGNSLLLCSNSGYNATGIITEQDLPSTDTMHICLERQAASDWFAEDEYEYSAMMLEEDSPIPSGCIEIPLRQFFWESKTTEQRKNAAPSDLGTLAARAHGFLELRRKYRFCPSCGGQMTDAPEVTAKKCTVCGTLHFPRLEPAVIVLVRKENKVLLVKSKTVRNGKKYFGCIAGFVEMGENLEQAVHREVMEEAGIRIKNVRYRGSQSWPFPDQLMLAFDAEYESGEIVLQESEIYEGGWFDLDELPEIPPEGSVAYNLIKNLF